MCGQNQDFSVTISFLAYAINDVHVIQIEKLITIKIQYVRLFIWLSFFEFLILRDAL